MKAKLVSVTPTLDTSAYASGDQVTDVMTISNALITPGAHAILDTVAIVDADFQSGALDILFFGASPTVASSKNAAMSITDAEMKAKCIGKLSIAGADYASLASNSVASKQANLPVTSLSIDNAAPTKDIYAIVVARSAPTYSASGLVLRFFFRYE